MLLEVDTLKDYSTMLQFCIFLGLNFSKNIIFSIKISVPAIDLCLSVNRKQ